MHGKLEALSRGTAQEARLSPGSGSSSGGAGGPGGRHELPGLGSGLDGIFGGGADGRVGFGDSDPGRFWLSEYVLFFLFSGVFSNDANSDI